MADDTKPSLARGDSSMDVVDELERYYPNNRRPGFKHPKKPPAKHDPAEAIVYYPDSEPYSGPQRPGVHPVKRVESDQTKVEFVGAETKSDEGDSFCKCICPF